MRQQGSAAAAAAWLAPRALHAGAASEHGRSKAWAVGLLDTAKDFNMMTIASCNCVRRLLGAARSAAAQ